jgi:hypothetical protein
MSKHRLQVLAPGRRLVEDETGNRVWVKFTPAQCRDYYERSNAMIRGGINTPVCWAHRDDQKPRKLSRDDWASERVKGTAGHVEQYEIDSENRVWTNVEIPDESDAKRAEAVRFCSPQIEHFTDGSGRGWGPVFTHIALTPRPVQHEQPPIARLSLSLMDSVQQEEQEESDEPTLADIADALRAKGFSIHQLAEESIENLLVAIEATEGTLQRPGIESPELEVNLGHSSRRRGPDDSQAARLRRQETFEQTLRGGQQAYV